MLNDGWLVDDSSINVEHLTKVNKMKWSEEVDWEGIMLQEVERSTSNCHRAGTNGDIRSSSFLSKPSGFHDGSRYVNG